VGLRTPLFDWHVARKARIVDFAGWDMPVIYTSISEEHNATRTAVGLFDISHMGRLRIEGAGAPAWLEKLITNRVDTLKVGQARYALVLNDRAGILDDVLLTRFPDYYLLVVNASNRTKLLAWFERIGRPSDVKLTDLTTATAMIACQGAKALMTAQPLFDVPLAGLRYYFAEETNYAGKPAIVSRTGYTGEDGVEIIVPADLAKDVWERLVTAGATPAGLGARDTLRLEAGMPLYGHELSEEIDPIQAGVGWAAKAKEKEFIGRDALMQRDPNRSIRVGLRLADKRIAREGFPVFKEGERVGVVASGTFSPTLEASLAMAYVPPALAAINTPLQVEVRGQSVPATVVGLPFYKRES
jgi:aminomethyltransferase